MPNLRAFSQFDSFYALGVGLGFVTAYLRHMQRALLGRFYALGVGLGFVTAITRICTLVTISFYALGVGLGFVTPSS